LVSFLICFLVKHQILNGVSYNDTSDGNMRALNWDVERSGFGIYYDSLQLTYFSAFAS